MGCITELPSGVRSSIAMAVKNPMFSPLPRRQVATLQFGDSKIHIVVPNDS